MISVMLCTVWRRPGTVRSVLMTVREDALVDDAAADVEAEVHAAVRGIEPDAAVGGLSHFGYEFAVGVEDAPGVRREVVRENVARLEHGEQRVDYLRVVAFGRVPDVDHEPDAGLARRSLGHSRHLHAHDLERRRDHARLDPLDEGRVSPGMTTSASRAWIGPW
jgi:hypothetical protein